MPREAPSWSPFVLSQKRFLLNLRQRNGMLGGLSWPSLEAVVSLLSGFAGVTERGYLNGVLGESVTFQVKTNLPIVSISWIKIVHHKPENISVVTFGEPCGLRVPLPALENRVKVSEDCRGLQLSRLEQDDRGYYVAAIFLPTEEMEYEFFDLEVSSKYPSHGSKSLPGLPPLMWRGGRLFCWGGLQVSSM